MSISTKIKANKQSLKNHFVRNSFVVTNTNK